MSCTFMTFQVTAIACTEPYPINSNSTPNANSIRTLKRELYANATSVPTSLGGGNHGHLGLITTAAEYAIITGAGVPAFIPPAQPVALILAGTAEVRAQQIETYKGHKEAHKTFTAISTLLKKQIIEAVPSEYIASLADDLLGYTNVTAHVMLQTLTTNYGTITQDDLEDNYEKLSAPWDPNSPIETVFTLVTSCRQFATAGGDAISDATAMREVLKMLEKSGVLDTAVEDWRLQAGAGRTFVRLLPFFVTATKKDFAKARQQAQATTQRTQQPKHQTSTLHPATTTLK